MSEFIELEFIRKPDGSHIESINSWMIERMVRVYATATTKLQVRGCDEWEVVTETPAQIMAKIADAQGVVNHDPMNRDNETIVRHQKVEINAMVESIKRLEKENADETHDFRLLIEGKDAVIDNLKADNAVHGEAVRKSVETVKAIESKLNEAVKSRQELVDMVGERDIMVDTLENRMKGGDKIITELKAKIREQNEMHDDLRINIHEKEGVIDDTRAEIAVLKEGLERTKKDLRDLHTEGGSC